MMEDVEAGENHGCMSVSSELFSGVSIFRFSFMLAKSFDVARSESDSSMFGLDTARVVGCKWGMAWGSEKASRGIRGGEQGGIYSTGLLSDITAGGTDRGISDTAFKGPQSISSLLASSPSKIKLV